MALIQPNFDEVTEVADGEYLARIVDAELKDSKAGNQYINWKVEIYGENAGKALGAQLKLMTMVNGRGAGGLQRLHRAVKGTDCPPQFDTESLLGQSIRITVGDEKRDGQLTGFKEVKAVKAVQ